MDTCHTPSNAVLQYAVEAKLKTTVAGSTKEELRATRSSLSPSSSGTDEVPKKAGMEPRALIRPHNTRAPHSHRLLLDNLVTDSFVQRACVRP